MDENNLKWKLKVTTLLFHFTPTANSVPLL